MQVFKNSRYMIVALSDWNSQQTAAQLETQQHHHQAIGRLFQLV
jgi:hypothetical protein